LPVIDTLYGGEVLKEEITAAAESAGKSTLTTVVKIYKIIFCKLKWVQKYFTLNIIHVNKILNK
jgi:hypothetical protein